MEENMVLRAGEQGYCFRAKDPISALTHFIGFWGALIGMPVLLIRAAGMGRTITDLLSLSVFMLSMVLLYGASTSYHSFHISEHGDKILKKMDHMMIFILIAGSYTPVCTIVLNNSIGKKMLLLVWSVALIGIGFKALWVTCPRWVSSVIYISMGWIAIGALVPLYQTMNTAAFSWLLTGGIVYTIGGVIYALKLPILQRYFKGFGAHELFHVFVMAGSFCHFVMMLNIL